MLQLLLAPVLSVSLSALALPNALIFEAVRDQAGRQVLFIRDCGRGGLPQDVSSLDVERCEEWQSLFAWSGIFETPAGGRQRYVGHSQRLAAILQRQRFDGEAASAVEDFLSEGSGVRRILVVGTGDGVSASDASEKLGGTA